MCAAKVSGRVCFYSNHPAAMAFDIWQRVMSFLQLFCIYWIVSFNCLTIRRQTDLASKAVSLSTERKRSMATVSTSPYLKGNLPTSRNRQDNSVMSSLCLSLRVVNIFTFLLVKIPSFSILLPTLNREKSYVCLFFYYLLLLLPCKFVLHVGI